jgi:hypothetical protein
MLMTGVSACTGRDPRQIDLATAGLYQAGVPLELPAKHELLLRELYWARRGPRFGDSRVPRGGLYGFTKGGRLESVCITEAGRPELFAAKFANGDLQYYRRVTAMMEKPYALISLSIGESAPGWDCGGCRFESWAKAFALLLCHDLTWHIAEKAPDLGFFLEIAAGPPGKTLSLWLDRILFEVPEASDSAPFLMCAEQLLPLFLRLRNEVGWNIAATSAPLAPRPDHAPVFAWHVEIVAEDQARVKRHGGAPHYQRAVFGKSDLQFDMSSRTRPRAYSCTMEGISHARIDFLERVLNEMIYAIAK